jgi:hypothetical protein
MSDVTSERRTGDGSSAVAHGVTTFAGVVLAVVAVFQILDGITAIAKDTIFVHGVNYTWQFNIQTWGWIHLFIGLIALATGIGIILSQDWSYIVGVFIAVLSSISNFMFLPYYPFWSLAVISLDILVIWALCNQLAKGRPA